MAEHRPGGRARAVQGVLLMTLAMLSIPLVDGIAKHLTASYSPFFLSWARYVVASSVVVPLAGLRFGRQALPATQRGAHLLRTLFLIVSMTLYFVALSRIPWATVASAYFVGPVVAVVLAIPLLKERLTWAKGASLALGFAGSLVILEPGAEVDYGLFLAFGAGICFALYMVSTRRAAATTDPLRMLAFQSLAGAVLLTPMGLGFWTVPALADVPAFLALGICSAAIHMLSIAAFARADASTLAPLVYLELVGAVAIGYVVFQEVPAPATLVGAVLIVAAGLILVRR